MDKKLDNFITAQPTLALRKYIDAYYFHTCDDSKSHLKYTYYPHINHAVTAYQSSNRRTKGNSTLISVAPNTFTSIYSRVKQAPHHVEIKGVFKKIGIVFKPYGINHFLDKPFLEYAYPTIATFKAWDPDFQKTVALIWEKEEIKDRVALLDTFILKQKTDQANLQFQTIVDTIIGAEQTMGPKDLAKHFHMSTKTLVRLFRKEMDCTPGQFLKIFRFRKSLEAYLHKEKISLTQAAMAHFYDQANFTHTVKNITAVTPKKLTKELSDLSNRIFWKIEA